MVKGMGNMLKQAQKLQSKIFKLQEEMADKTVETSVGGGMVTVVANGKQEVVSIKVDQEVVNPDDVQMLEDLIVAGVNDA
ncbi:MAG: YbaB/EbfC family nucleoid-associated protein, partial [Deltaproteobacteria bacterium]|nr:YbaB/EbfC family nucleoid-associated protein [Deltaproteobacteria bacterium]